ncbi:unnamed protein product [Lymnaea stagnalis]|uniref:15-oxoprostaglandin 13-reductase n=1 Tax=Lymnaea stagnalis TaxID=6523 RepID=A0AAV2I5G0_LYMST
MAKAQVWKLKTDFDGIPKEEDFELVEEDLLSLKDNEILVQAVYLSLNPYFRVVASVQKDLPGEQVAKIIESKATDFPVGSLVCVHAGWRSHTVVDVTLARGSGNSVELIQEVPELSLSLWLGAAGMPGVTAYLSFLEKCDPKSGEVIVVTAASGAVGATVGQLAKNLGLTVIGIAGSKDKCEYIKSLGFDYAINYKEDNMSDALDKAAPNGVDIYYDNVGGTIADTVYGKLRDHGRVLICGLISNYNTSEEKGKNWSKDILFKKLKIQGFIVYDPANLAKFSTTRNELISLLLQGKVKAKEHVTEGFTKMPAAFIELFTGANFGKAIVKA